MSEKDSIRDIFFEECEDLLEALSEGLAEMASGSRDEGTVNAVFRAVHSIKGGAGAFQLGDLVGFAHSFETVLDRVRSNDLQPDDDLIRLLQKSGDLLADLVEGARDDIAADAGAIAATSDALEAVLGDFGNVEEEDLEFEVVALDFNFDLPVPEATPTTYKIAFAPERDLYSTGHEPLVLIKALQEMGDTTITADLSHLPGVDSFDWEESYLAWEIILTSDADEAAVRQVFEFVDGCCTLNITAEQQDDPVEITEPEIVEEPPQAAPAESAPPPVSISRKTEPRATLRVDVQRIDRLINTVGELIINQAMIAQRMRELGVGPTPELDTELDGYKQLARDIQEGVMGLRTQPVKQLFQRMTRITRESADVAEKLVTLVVEGEETEVDRKVIEKLADPLTHMVRNAIDHGLETTEERRDAGKSEQGVVRLTAQYKSGDVLIQVADDGAGLNRPRIRQIAIDKKLIPEDAELSDGEIDNLLFRPGFSTASSVTSLSGRGVGMDVVKTAITSLGGRISIASTPGEGSVFSILLPLTLAVLDGMVVRVGDETMVIPIACVEEAIRPHKRDLSLLGAGQLLFASRGDYLPVIDLGARLGQVRRKKPKVTKQTLLIVQSNGTRAAIAVDCVVDKRQVVIKSLAKNYRHIAGIAAATILGDGKVALIVDPDGITDDPPSQTVKHATPEEATVTEETGHAA